MIVLFGNNDAPCNYPANCYAPMRQDSSFLYYFGQHRDGLVGVIDIDNDEEMLFGDDIDVEDIVWMGFTPSVADLAAEVGVSKTAPMAQLTSYIKHQTSKIHYLPPYRFDTKIQIMDLLGIHPSQQKEKASLTLIQAVVKMRSTKEAQEIEAIDRACDAHHCPAIDQTRGDRTLHWRSGRRHCPFVGKPGELRHHLQSAWRDYAWKSVGGKVGGWQTGVV